MATYVPLISVSVPAYMQAHYLPICLDAIWFQEYPRIEIVVVNPASPDDTAAVLEQYQHSLHNDIVSFASYYNEETNVVERFYHQRFAPEGRTLRIVELDEDPGLSETYNIGLREAQGEYVTAIVADDIPHPAMFRELANELDGGADFAYADQFIVDDTGRILRRFSFPDFTVKRCLQDWYLMGNCRMWRRSLHEQCGWFNPSFPITQDYELIVRFAEAGGRFSHIPRVLYSQRFHGKDRQTGNHSPEREPLIHEESKRIALRARRSLQR